MAENQDQQDLIKLLADEARERKKLSEESKKAAEAAKNKEERQKEYNKSLKGQLLTQFKINDALKEAELSNKNIANSLVTQNKSQVQFQKSLGLGVSDANKITKSIFIWGVISKISSKSTIGLTFKFFFMNVFITITLPSKLL